MYLLILLLVCYSKAYPCGECICRERDDVLSCSGWNVTKLPDLISTTWVQHVDIINTSITDIQHLSTFANLYSADVRDNELLKCDSVLKLKPLFYVVTDCDDYVIHANPSTIDMEHNPTDWTSLLALSPIIFIIALMGYLRTKINVILQQLINTPAYSACDQTIDEKEGVPMASFRETLV